MRRPLIAANWKMHKLPSEVSDWLAELLAALPLNRRAELLLNVPATHLPVLARRLEEEQRAAHGAEANRTGQPTGNPAPAGSLEGDPVALGGQDLSAHDQGAYTGEISGAMLYDAGARFVIVGHSERRAFHQETDELVNAKIIAARRNGLVPILCVGESASQRDAGAAEAVVLKQLEQGLTGIELTTGADLVVAYEPIWAIGTGRTATAADAQQMSATVRSALARLLPRQADDIRILYGGSMKPANAGELLAQSDIDGGLIGGASLDPAELVAIVRAA